MGMNNYRRPIKKDPLAVADIKARREAGETLASIGKRYGVTREYIRQVCSSLNIKVKTPSQVELARTAEAMLEQEYLSLDELATALKTSIGRLKTGAKNAGIDLGAAQDRARAHQHDNKRFGMWTVIPGTYRREFTNSDNAKPTPMVDCKCDCGTVRSVMLGNLQGGVSRGCGCRNRTNERKRVPWICLETNERTANTSELAKKFDVNNMALVRRRNHDQDWTAPDGTTWRALPEEAVDHVPFFKEKYKAS